MSYILGEYQDRPGRLTTDQLFIVRQIVEKFWEFTHTHTDHLFIDFKWSMTALTEISCMLSCWTLIFPQNLLETLWSTQGQVKIDGQLTDKFEIRQGLKQGDGLAPMLFNLTPDTSLEPLEFTPMAHS